MLTLRANKVRSSNTAIWSACCVLFGLYAIWLSYCGINDWSIRMQERFWNEMGFLSIFLGIGSVYLWFRKKRILQAKKVQNGTTVSLMREAHIVLGWLSFAIGLGHSIFFIVNDIGRASRNFTGYVALLIMLFVILSGALYQHKVLKLRVIRQGHFVFACLLGLIMLVHI